MLRCLPAAVTGRTIFSPLFKRKAATSSSINARLSDGMSAGTIIMPAAEAETAATPQVIDVPMPSAAAGFLLSDHSGGAPTAQHPHGRKSRSAQTQQLLHHGRGGPRVCVVKVRFALAARNGEDTTRSLGEKRSGCSSDPLENTEPIIL